MATKRRCLICTDLSKLQGLGFKKEHDWHDKVEYVHRICKIRVTEKDQHIMIYGFNIDTALVIIQMAKLDILKEGEYEPKQMTREQKVALNIMSMVDDKTREKIAEIYFKEGELDE